MPSTTPWSQIRHKRPAWWQIRRRIRDWRYRRWLRKVT